MNLPNMTERTLPILFPTAVSLMQVRIYSKDMHGEVNWILIKALVLKTVSMLLQVQKQERRKIVPLLTGRMVMMTN